MPESKPFDQMTSAEQRVAIATDAAGQLAAQRIFARCGYYCVIEAAPTEDVGFREFLPTAPPCKVCGIGALFVASIRLANKITIGPNSQHVGFRRTEVGSHTIYGHLSSWFAGDQLDAIEQAFEGENITKDYDNSEDAQAYFAAVPDAESRLEAIMRNIIRNGGEFIPDVDADLATIK